MFRDTFVVLGGKTETYNPDLWSGALHSTCYCCLRSNHAQWVQQWRPHQSFHVRCFCVEFPRFIGIYWLLFVAVSRSFLNIARDRTASYCIVISLSISWYVSSAQIYRCIGTTVNSFTPGTNAGLFSIRPSGTNFREILTQTSTFSLKKCVLKCHLWVQDGSHCVSIFIRIATRFWEGLSCWKIY